MQCAPTSRSRLPILVIAAVSFANLVSVNLVSAQKSSPPATQDSTTTAGGSADSSPPSPQAELPVPRWFLGPNRQDFAWNVRTFPPTLTFQQRQLVTIEATFRAGDLFKTGVSSGLYFALKLAKEDGSWLPGSSVGYFELPPRMTPHDHVRAFFGMYVEPGTYKASLMAFDDRTKKGNLWHETLRIPTIYRDPLPESQHHLPAVEFLTAAPPFASGREWMMTHDPWDFGQSTLTIPVANDVPLEVDVVANLSLSNATNARHSEAPDWMYQINAATVTEISRVLSELDLNSGCIRLSALDIPRQELFVDRQDTRNFDWSKIKTAMEAGQRSKIDVHVLASEKKLPSFLGNFLGQLADDPPSCQTPPGKSPIRILIVVSDAFIFPNGTEMTRAHPSNAWARSYHLELVPAVGPHWDEINNVLKPLNPARVEVSTPAAFRRVLVELIHELEQISRNSASPQAVH